jgi:GT2 family glycosyltransferase
MEMPGLRFSEPTVSAVICAHQMERVDWVADAARSLLAQSLPPTEVLVVADWATDDVISALEERLPEGVTLLPNRWVRGLSHARNTGASASSGELIAFLDDDALAAPDWLQRLAAHFRDPWVAAAGGRAVPDWLGAKGRPWWLPEELDWVVGCTFKGFADRQEPVRNVLGSNMCFRRRVLQEIGGFDPRVGGPISGDDTEVCLRIQEADPHYRIVHDEEAIVHHKVPPERQTPGYLLRSSWDQGVGKAVIRRLHPHHAQALSSEGAYLRSLPGFIAGRSAAMAGGRLSGGGHILAALASVGAVGYGYASTRLRDLLAAAPSQRPAVRTSEEGTQTWWR